MPQEIISWNKRLSWIDNGSSIWERNYAIQETPLAAAGLLFFDHMQVFDEDLFGFGAVNAVSGDWIWLTEEIKFSFGDFVLYNGSNQTFRRTDYPDFQ